MPANTADATRQSLRLKYFVGLILIDVQTSTLNGESIV